MITSDLCLQLETKVSVQQITTKYTEKLSKLVLRPLILQWNILKLCLIGPGLVSKSSESTNKIYKQKQY